MGGNCTLVRLFVVICSEIKLPEKGIEVGFVNLEVGRVSFEVLNLIERLKEAHFRDGILFGARERMSVRLRPFSGCVVANENPHREGLFAISGNHVNVLGTRNPPTASFLNFVKVILVNKSGDRRIAFYAPDHLWASHAGIILLTSPDVNKTAGSGGGRLKFVQDVMNRGE